MRSVKYWNLHVLNSRLKQRAAAEKCHRCRFQTAVPISVHGNVCFRLSFPVDRSFLRLLIDDRNDHICCSCDREKLLANCFLLHACSFFLLQSGLVVENYFLIFIRYHVDRKKEGESLIFSLFITFQKYEGIY